MKAFFQENLPQLIALDENAPVWLEELRRVAQAQGLDDLAQGLAVNSSVGDFLGTVCTLSPFLRDVLIGHPDYLAPLLEYDLASQLDNILAQISLLDGVQNLSETQLMRNLRCYKQQASLLIALGDLGQLFDVGATTRFLSRLAEAALSSALRFLLRQAHAQGHIELVQPQNPEIGCGLVLLGLGKLGAFELNYSSDIDLIAFIDETAPAIVDVGASVDVFSKLMRRLVRIMQERTEQGYVFRVDLRLRPDPASTPLALPFGAALHYYESRGQNWERAAFIKARTVAGDRKAGEKLLKELAPYIWRKYLDYATIADIASIKNQIHQTRGFNTLEPHGANVKLGRGGIREIEFFVQAQQLIAGGRVPQLRGRSTLDMLSRLCEFGWITSSACDQLRQNYVYLRRVEHRIQMVADEQSHILPQDEQGFLTIALMMGYHDAQTFCTDLRQVMNQVENHYRALFADNELAKEGNKEFNFMGVQADLCDLEALARLGFTRINDIERIIRGWHKGEYRAIHSAQARARLRQLIPDFLQAISATKRADETLLHFDAFLRAMPAGIQLFSLLQSNKGLLDMLMIIMGSAPRLSDIITRKPHVFDGMLDPTLFSELPQPCHLEQRLNLFLQQATNYEEKLDRLRIFAAEQRFLIGVRLLGGTISALRTGEAFSDLADLMIAKTLELVSQEFVNKHGQVEGGKIAILALGKLGSRELRAGSDVDLILLYEHDEAFEMSDGAKPLYVSQYYARLTQRLIAALCAPTAEGILYQVDMRLRPSGNKGPVAVPFNGFGRYQREQAWVWEHLALSRARPISGEGDLCDKITTDIATILSTSYPTEQLIEEIAAMRARIAQEKPAKGVWDLKYCAGGIIDVEFIAQYSVLSAYVPYQAGQTTGNILASLPESFCSEVERQSLIESFCLYSNLNQTINLCLAQEFDVHQAPPGLVDILLNLTAQPDLNHLVDLLQKKTASIQAIFKRLFS